MDIHFHSKKDADKKVAEEVKSENELSQSYQKKPDWLTVGQMGFFWFYAFFIHRK
jgi:hypothetical protein